MPEIVALARAEGYDDPNLEKLVSQVLEESHIKISAGARVLVKPNLLTKSELACTNPGIVAATCKWLLDKGAKVTVGDSPAFGTALSVAKAIGLTAALMPLRLEVTDFGKIKKLRLKPANSTLKPVVGIAAEALESDLILSIPKVKAHSQLRLTLGVKNCYGVICGLRKAICHARFGDSLDFFCDCVTALWRELPPVAALCDGVIAMHQTGPIHGKPFKLKMIAASRSAPAADLAIVNTLRQPVSALPLLKALSRIHALPEAIAYPMLEPEDFNANGFTVPDKLKEISFNPLYLARSLLKRIWLTGNG